MTYYEELNLARKNNLNALNIYCASEAEWFVRDYCEINEFDSNYANDINNIAGSIKEAYIKFDRITFEEIEENLMYLRDNYKKLSIEEIGDNLLDSINNELSPDLVEDSENERGR